MNIVYMNVGGGGGSVGYVSYMYFCLLGVTEIRTRLTETLPFPIPKP